MMDQYGEDSISSRSAGDQQVFTADGVSFVMVYVPGGLSFKTGVDDNGDIDGDGVQDVPPTATVAHAYWIAETEVTYQLWKKVYDWATDVARGTKKYTFSYAGTMGTTNLHPVTTISWRDMIVFCNALTEWYNAHTGTNYSCAYFTDTAYTAPIRLSTTSGTITYTTPGSQDFPYIKASFSGNTSMDNCTATGFRLTTGNEWELAARYKGGDDSYGAYQYPPGSGYWWSPGSYASGATAPYTDVTATGLVAWYVANYGSGTHEVKKKHPNALGLYDMSGNIMEYCFEWHPLNIGTYRIKYGGYYSGSSEYLRIGRAYFNTLPRVSAAGTNFRLARTE